MSARLCAACSRSRSKATRSRASWRFWASRINGAAYEACKDKTSVKKALSVPELEEWLLEKFQKDLRIPLPDKTTDIFSAGVDSLQTTRIWRAIKKDLDLGSGSDSLSQNAVFEQGTVEARANHLYQLRTGGDASKEEDETKVMEELIEKYSNFTTHFPATASPPEKEVLLVTGATGNLGSRLVPALLTHGHSVVVYVRSVSKLESLIPATVHEQITIVQGDATDAQAIKKAIIGHKCEAVVSTAGVAALAPWAKSELPVIFKAVLDAVREAGAERGSPLRVWFLGGQGVLYYPGTQSMLSN